MPAPTVDDVAHWAGISQRSTTVDDLLAQCLGATVAAVGARLGPWVTNEAAARAVAESGIKIGSFDWRPVAGVSDPGVGRLYVDAATTLVVSTTDRFGADATVPLAAITPGHIALLQLESNANQWITHTVVGSPESNPTWMSFPVELASTALAGWTPNINADVGLVDFPPDERAPEVDWPPTIFQAVVMQSARLYKRRSSPEGVAGFGDLGIVRVTTFDPDIEAMLNPDLGWFFG